MDNIGGNNEKKKTIFKWVVFFIAVVLISWFVMWIFDALPVILILLFLGLPFVILVNLFLR